MDWKTLMGVRLGTPLTELGIEPEHLVAALWRISEDAYVSDTRLPTVLRRIYWAGSEGAARRCVAHQVEADQDHSPVIPPAELLLGANGPTHGEIERAAKAAGLKPGSSGPTWGGFDFAYIHYDLIVKPSHVFYFRGPKPSKKETPYAIDYTLQR